MNHKVDAAPGLFAGFEQLFQLVVAYHIAGLKNGDIQSLSQRLNKGAGFLILVGHGDLSAGGTQGFGAAVSDAVFVSHTNHNSFFSLQGQRHFFCSISVRDRFCVVKRSIGITGGGAEKTRLLPVPVS